MGVRIINDIVKVYPDMLKIVIYHKPYALPESRAQRRQVSSNSDASRDRSIRRTRQVVSDIIACNQFDLWCTFTFNCRNCNTGCQNWKVGNRCICPKGQCRRFDANICRYRMSSWLHRQKVNNPRFKYIIVPEKHESGALHFHAFVKDCNAQLSDTGKVKNGHKILKFRNYHLGWSHVIDISNGNAESHNKIASYMQKYIKKGMITFNGKKRYWCSNNLQRPHSYVNGIDKFNLAKVITGQKPAYITDKLEVQYHPIQDFNPTNNRQSSFSYLSTSLVKPLKDSLTIPETGLSVSSH